jgi:hypothetical protein
MRPLLALAAAALLSVGSVEAKSSVKTDFNPKAEFERYKTWDWAPDLDKQKGVLADATMRQRIEAALATRLKKAGLRRVEAGEQPDLLVRYQGDIGSGKTVVTSSGSVTHMVEPEYATLQFTEQIATLIVDLVDNGTSALAWRLYLDQAFGGPNDPPDKLAKALDKGFAKYPPSTSARAKKAREAEKAP